MRVLTARFMGGDQSMSDFFTNMYGTTFWNLIFGCYEYHCHYRNQNRETENAARHQERDNIIREISDINIDDIDVSSIRLSDTYKISSLNNR